MLWVEDGTHMPYYTKEVEFMESCMLYCTKSLVELMEA